MTNDPRKAVTSGNEVEAIWKELEAQPALPAWAEDEKYEYDLGMSTTCEHCGNSLQEGARVWRDTESSKDWARQGYPGIPSDYYCSEACVLAEAAAGEANITRFKVTLSSQHFGVKETTVTNEQEARRILSDWYANTPAFGKIEVFDGVSWNLISTIGVSK